MAGGLRADQLPAECVGDATSDLVLYGEEIPDIVVETLRPKMPSRLGVNKLAGNAHAIANPTNAPL